MNQKPGGGQPLCPHCSQGLYGVDYHAQLGAYSCPWCHKVLSLSKMSLDSGSIEILRQVLMKR